LFGSLRDDDRTPPFAFGDCTTILEVAPGDPRGNATPPFSIHKFGPPARGAASLPPALFLGFWPPNLDFFMLGPPNVIQPEGLEIPPVSIPPGPFLTPSGGFFRFKRCQRSGFHPAARAGFGTGEQRCTFTSLFVPFCLWNDTLERGRYVDVGVTTYYSCDPYPLRPTQHLLGPAHRSSALFCLICWFLFFPLVLRTNS